MKDLNYYKNLGIFNKEQLSIIELSLTWDKNEERLTDDQISLIAKPEYDQGQMLQILNGIAIDKIDITKFNDIKYNSLQMQEIRDGLVLKLDITKFNNYKLNYKQMMIIKDGIKLGLNVDLYNSCNYSYELMMKIFKVLKSKRIKPENKDKYINLLLIES